MKKFDVAYAIPPAKDGDKPRWINCGAILETRNGLRIKLDTIPVGFNGWFALFDPKPREERQPAPKQQAPKLEDGDEIPF